MTIKEEGQQKVYKIRDKNTGLFSCGGDGPRWSRVGKTWSSMGNLKNHLALFRHWRTGVDERLKDWEIVEFTLAVFSGPVLEKSAYDLISKEGQ